MRLRALDIDGFGLFDQMSSGELPPGLVVLFSADERRKDTLLAFVRGLLFGMSNGNWPLAGAPPGGGALTIDGPNGTYFLRRRSGATQANLLAPDGRSVSGDEMTGLLTKVANGATRRFFDVALAQLRAYVAPPPESGLAADDLWRLTMDQRRAAAVIERFRAERNRLLGTADARIDTLLAELAMIEAEISAARARDDEYPAHVRREGELRDEVGRLCGELAEQRKARERLHLAEELWPSWNECGDAQRSLDVLEPIDEFPDETMNLVDATRELAAARQELQRLEQTRDRAQRALDDIPPGDDRHEVLAAVEALCGEVSAYRSKLSAFATARARHAELSRLLPESARRVAGPGGETSFDPARLDLQEARRWQARAQHLVEREAATRAALETTRAALRQLRAEQDKALREGDPSSLTMNPLDRRWLSLWRLRRNLDELWSVQSHGEAKARLAEERAVELRLHPHQRWRVPPRWLRLFIWVFVGGAFAATLIAVGSDRRTRTMLFGSLAFLGMLTDLVLAWRGRLAQVRNGAAQAEENRLLWDLEQTRQARDQHWRRAGDLAEAIRSEARLLGLPEVPEEHDIDAQVERLWGESTARAEVGVLTQIALSLRAKVDEEAMLAAQLAEVREARTQAGNDWGAWKVSVGLPEHLAEEQLSTYLCEFDRWRELRREAEHADADLNDLGPEIKAWEQGARATLARVGAKPEDNLCGRDLVDRLTMLRESARRSDQRRRRRLELERDIETFATASEHCRGRIEAAAAAVDQLAQAAGTTDHEEFDRRRRIYDRRRLLRRDIHQLQGALEARLAHLPVSEREAVRELLAGGDRAQWQTAIQGIDETVHDLEAALQETAKQQIEAAAMCRHLEESTATVAACQQRAALLSELSECACEWRRLTVAEALIESTVGDHDNQHEAAMLVAASRLLEYGSDGLYTRIVRGSGGSGLRLVDRAGCEHEVPDEVDSEVAEQLYLSLHLVSARELARQDGAPPLLLDDVLRDLDDQRGRRMAEEIAHFANEHQVLYFTSHRPTLERLRAARAQIVEV